MKRSAATWFALPLYCSSLFAQSSAPAKQIQTFHIRGTVRDSTGTPVRESKVQVTFKNEKMIQTVVTNEAGVYEADLPVGIYTMTAEGLMFRPYRRPEFRILSPIDVTLDVTLPRSPHLMSRHGFSPEDREASNVRNYDGDFFSVPSDGHVPFRLYIRYVRRIRTDYSYDYSGDNAPPYDDPVFVAYNLFSLQANTVVYDMESRRLEARGNVVVEDESGKRRLESANFKIENGKAKQLP